jgi:hypothetical protein
MALPNATQMAANWANGMAQAGEKIRAGVQAVTEAPTAKAARRTDAMLAGLQRAIASGKVAAGLNAVSLEDWKSATLNKGIGRVAAGAAAAKPKVQNFAQQFLPHLEAGLRELDSMPRGDIETNIARATAMMRHNAKFRMSPR